MRKVYDHSRYTCCVDGCGVEGTWTKCFDHMQKHWDNRICSECFKILPSARQASVHCSDVTSPFSCPKCGKILKTRLSAVNHLLSWPICFYITTGRNCYWCSNEFESHSALLQHEEARVARGKLACCVCEWNKVKAISTYLHDHMAAEHSDWEETCTRCGMRFTKPTEYEVHCRNHEKYTCKICGKAFR